MQPRAQSAEGRKVFLNQRFVGFEEGFTLSARVEMGGQGRAFTYIGQCWAHCLVSSCSYNEWSISELNWEKKDKWVKAIGGWVYPVLPILFFFSLVYIFSDFHTQFYWHQLNFWLSHIAFCFAFSVIVDQQFFFLGIILILGKFNVEIDETLKKYETYFAYASHGSLGCRLHMKNILDFEKYSHLLFNSSSIWS